MGWIQRKQTLRSLTGVTDKEMCEAACEAQRIRDQRDRSRKQQPHELLQLRFQSFNRKLRRALRKKHEDKRCIEVERIFLVLR